ncbi:ATP-binding protein [Streptomyces sp. NPDC005009]
MCDDTVVVASELLTDVLTHAAGERIVCRLHVLTDRIRVEVEDQARGPEPPVLRRPGPDDQNGRGPLLVDVLSSDRAVTRAPGRAGRVVRAEPPTGRRVSATTPGDPDSSVGRRPRRVGQDRSSRRAGIRGHGGREAGGAGPGPRGDAVR